MIFLILLTLCLNIILVILEQFGNKLNKTYPFFIIFLMLQAGLRGVNTNHDNLVYIRVYNELIPTLDKYKFFNNTFVFFERGYTFLNVILKTIGCNSRGMFVVVSILSLGIIGFVIKKYCKYKYLCMYIYITNFYYINDFIIIRTGIAMGLILLSIKYLQKNKKFILYTLLAFSFHRISFLNFIPFFIIKFFKEKNRLYNLKIILGIILISFVMGLYSPVNLSKLFLAKFFGNKFTYYFDYPTPGNYRKLLLYFPMLLYFLKYNKKYSDNSLFFNSYIYLIMANITTLLLVENIFFNRIPYMFSISKIYLYDIIMIYTQRKKRWTLFIVCFEALILLWSLRIYKGTVF